MMYAITTSVKWAEPGPMDNRTAVGENIMFPLGFCSCSNLCGLHAAPVYQFLKSKKSGCFGLKFLLLRAPGLYLEGSGESVPAPTTAPSSKAGNL